MKNNKLICVVLALLVCLTMAVSASATTETKTGLNINLVPTTGTTVDDIAAAAGSEIKMNVVVESNPGVKFGVAYINYDATILELTEAVSKSDDVVVNKVTGKIAVVIGDKMAMIDPDTAVVNVTGVVAELTFKVKETATDVASNGVTLEVSKNNVIDKNNEVGTTEVSEDVCVNVAVVSKDHVCDENALVEMNAKAATCCEAGKTADKVCPVCKKIIVAGETIAKLEHTWDEGTVTTAPTCTEKGVKTYKCTVEGCACEDAVKTEEIAALGHTEVVDAAVAATCTSTGLTEGKHCSVCNEVLVAQALIEKLPHDFDDGVILVKPTCTEKGTRLDTCKVCNFQQVTDLEVQGHVWVEDAAVAPTCTEKGATAGKHCYVCGAVEGVEEIAALGHTEVIDKAVAATCTTAGLTEGKHCSVCNEVLVAQKTVDALGHDKVVDASVAPGCTTPGKSVGWHCTRCSEKSEQTEIPAIGSHSYDDGVIVVLPTCSEMGTRKYTCTLCGETKLDDKVPATGEHTWSDWETTKEATVEAEGEQTRTCSICKKAETKAIEKLPEPENNTVLIVVIIVVVVLAGGGVAAYFVLKNKKK